MNEDNVVRFINIFQGGISVCEYSLKFTKLSKYDPSFVFDTKEEMRNFVTGVSNDLQKECHLVMLHENMNTSHLMVHAKHMEEATTRMKSRDAKRARSFDGGSSNNRIQIQDNSRFKKRVSSHVPSKFPKVSGYRVSNPKFNKGKGTNSPTK